MNKQSHFIKKFLGINAIQLPSDEEFDYLQGRSESGYGGLFLNYYNQKNIKKTLRDFHIFRSLKQQGFRKIDVRIKAMQTCRHRVQMYACHGRSTPLLLGELVVCDGKFHLPYTLPYQFSQPVMRSLIIQWIKLQNPFATFQEEKPVLPGQCYPGLGVGRNFQELLSFLGEHHEFDLISNSPEFFHNALMYSRTYYYLDPVRQGQMLALWRDLQTYGLSTVSWAIYLGCVHEKGARRHFEWFHEDQIKPINPELSNYVTSDFYHQKVDHSFENHHYELLENRYKKFDPILPDGSPRFNIAEDNYR